MKAVLLSIKPEYCELIASGKKTIEIRKTKPKLKTPFKCYIYETKAINHQSSSNYISKGSGKIIGEFICDLIVLLDMDSVGLGMWEGNEFVYIKDNGWDACLTKEEILDYAGYNRPYGWHISNLIIYDKPKELSKFYKTGGRQCVSDNGRFCKYIQASPGDDPADANTMSCIYGEQNCPFEYLSRPPQSWCYVEEINDA